MVNKIDLDDNGPFIVDNQFPREPYTDGKKISLDEMIGSGYLEKMQFYTHPKYWPTMIERVLEDEFLMQGFAVLQRIMRNHLKRDGRVTSDLLCPEVKLVSPDMIPIQLEHCKSCPTCRFVLGMFDFHSFKHDTASLAKDFFVSTIREGLVNASEGEFHMNGCPFINSVNEVDPNGFCWICPGSGNHSTYPAANGQVVFAPRAGTRLAETYIVMKIIANGHFTKGEYHVKLRIGF